MRAAGILLCALLMLAPSRASAGDAEAAKAFEDGRKLFEQKDAAGALPLFQKAVEQSQSPNARLYLARCLRDTGRLTQAYDEMARTVRDAREAAEKDERYVATRDAAAAELALLEGKVGHLVISLDSTLAGATVTLQGTTVGAAELGKPVTVLPGTLRVVAAPPSGAPIERSITVAAGATQSLSLALKAAGVGPTPEKPPETPTEGGGFGVVRGVGIGVAAIGVGGFATFAVGTIIADNKLKSLEEACGAGPCSDTSYSEVIDSGKTAETIAFVGLGVGIAGVVAGTLMIAFGGASEATKAGWQPTPDGFLVRF